MKQIALVMIIFFTLPTIAFGEEYHRKGYHEDLYKVTQSVTQEQHFKHFMIDLLHQEIILSARKYYKDQEISGMSFDWENKYNVVEIIEPHLVGQESDFPYIIKFTVMPGNKTTKGTDTLTFGVSVNSHPDSKESITIDTTLINYEHNDPPKE